MPENLLSQRTNVSVRKVVKYKHTFWSDLTPTRAVIYLLLMMCAAITLVPLLWLVCAAFKHQDDMFRYTFVPYGSRYDKLIEVGIDNKPLAEFLIKANAIRIGSDTASEIRVENATPSAVVLENISGDWKLKSSDQAVRINGASKTAHTFTVNDEISVGGRRFKFEQAHIPTTQNFEDLFGRFNFGRYLLNSFFLTCTRTSIALILVSMGGFALAKYSFAGKNAVMLLMLATMMIPSSVLLAPNYELLVKFGLMNSYVGVIVPGIVSAFGMLLYRQAMISVPDDLIEAARIDGCSELRIYWEVMMPVVRPMSGAFCLMAFMANWNDFLMPMIVLQSDHLFTVPIVLSQTLSLTGENLYGLLMAGTFIGVLPPAILFFILQREFIAGLTSGAVKG